MTGRSERRFAFLLTFLLASVGLGHEDLRIVDATVTIEPGATLSYPAAVHYHRIVGRYTVVNAEAGAPEVSIAFAVEGPEADTHVAADADPARIGGFETVLVNGLAQRGTVDTLIRCCDERVWTPAELRLLNDGEREATVQLRVWAVHDDFAVVVDRAEDGALGVPLTLFSALGAMAAFVAVRNRRHDRIVPHTAGLPASVRLSALLLIASCALALALGVAGAVRYGTGPISGMMAILADLPVPGGPFGARGATVMGILMLAWIVAIGAWIRALHLGTYRTSPWPRRLGLALGGVSLASGVAMGWTYASFGVPLLLGLVLAVPLIGIAATLRTDPPRSAAP